MMGEGNFVIDGTGSEMTGRTPYPTVAQLTYDTVREAVEKQLAEWISIREKFPTTLLFSKGYQEGQIVALGHVLEMLERMQR